jgi:nucleoid DNA-binding protein
MPRVKVDWRSASKENYNEFCKKHIDIKLTFDEWRNIIYAFNEAFRDYILETGEKIKLPFGFGEFSINKKKRRKMKGADGKEFINLPIDWQKTKEKGKVIYNFNYHTEGFFFGWHWFKRSARFKHSDLWYFKASRTTSRLITHYINADDKYQHVYCQWTINNK